MLTHLLAARWDRRTVPGLWSLRAPAGAPPQLTRPGAMNGTAAADPTPAHRLPDASLGEHLEPQRAGDRDRLDETHVHPVAEAIAFAGRIADQGVVLFVIAIVIFAERASRNEAVGAGIVEPDEQARPGDTRNM